MKFLNTDFNLCLNSLSAWRCETGYSQTHAHSDKTMPYENESLRVRYTERVVLQIAPQNQNKKRKQRKKKKMLQVLLQCKFAKVHPSPWLSNQAFWRATSICCKQQKLIQLWRVPPTMFFVSFEGLTISTYHSIGVTSLFATLSPPGSVQRESYPDLLNRNMMKIWSLASLGFKVRWISFCNSPRRNITDLFCLKVVPVVHVLMFSKICCDFSDLQKKIKYSTYWKKMDLS